LKSNFYLITCTAGDGFAGKVYPGFNIGELDHNGWWMYATDDTLGNKLQTDNFFLRNFLGKKGGNKKKTNNTIDYNDKDFTPPELAYPLNETDYNDAVELLNRFTYVLDIQCLSEGMIKIAKQLELNMDGVQAKIKLDQSSYHNRRKKHSLSNLERIGYDDVYQYLMNKNKWDIEIYKYSKSISVINCSHLSTGGN